MSGDPHDASARAAVRAVRGGEQEAFAVLVEAYQRRLFGLAFMMTRDAFGAEEVAQDAFVRAFMHLESYDSHRPFYPWLAKITVRLAQNWLVKRSRLSAHEGSRAESQDDGVTPDAYPLEDMIADEQDRALWRAVAALPHGERTAVILHYRQDMDVADIAAALGVSQGTVKTQLFRARNKLRRTLADDSHLRGLE